MDNSISAALNPSRFTKQHKPTIRYRPESPSPVWPLPAFNGREPSGLPPVGRAPRGIDLAYPRLVIGEVASCAPNTPNGTDTHFMPEMTPVFAADDGEVTYAGRLSHGSYAVVIDHLDGRATYYSNLAQLTTIRTDLYRKRAHILRAGDSIGIVGNVSPGGFKHLHFELWRRNRDRVFVPIDPAATMADWRVLQWTDHLTPIEPAAAKKAA